MSHPIAVLSQLQAGTRHETMYSNSSHSTWARAKTYHAAQGRIFQQGMHLETSANMQSDCSSGPHFLGGVRVGVRPIVCAHHSISVPPSSKYTFCKVTQLYTSPAARGRGVYRVDGPRTDRFEDRGCRTLSPRGSLAWLRHDAG